MDRLIQRGNGVRYSLFGGGKSANTNQQNEGLLHAICAYSFLRTNQRLRYRMIEIVSNLQINRPAVHLNTGIGGEDGATVAG
jgi:hypothetical protein